MSITLVPREAPGRGVVLRLCSIMLRVRRAGVSVATSELEEQGLITKTRAHIHILDRAGLERSSCECYKVARTEADRLPGVEFLAA
jgi:hypothetical protein